MMKSSNSAAKTNEPTTLNQTAAIGKEGMEPFVIEITRQQKMQVEVTVDGDDEMTPEMKESIKADLEDGLAVTIGDSFIGKRLGRTHTITMNEDDGKHVVKFTSIDAEIDVDDWVEIE